MCDEENLLICYTKKEKEGEDNNNNNGNINNNNEIVIIQPINIYNSIYSKMVVCYNSYLLILLSDACMYILMTLFGVNIKKICQDDDAIIFIFSFSIIMLISNIMPVNMLVTIRQDKSMIRYENEKKMNYFVFNIFVYLTSSILNLITVIFMYKNLKNETCLYIYNDWLYGCFLFVLSLYKIISVLYFCIKMGATE